MDRALIAIHALVACLLLAGLAGSVLPFLPGTPLIFLGAVAGLALGLLVRLALAVTMVGLVVRWLWVARN